MLSEATLAPVCLGCARAKRHRRIVVIIVILRLNCSTIVPHITVTLKYYCQTRMNRIHHVKHRFSRENLMLEKSQSIL
jgi:hypothetical protein